MPGGISSRYFENKYFSFLFFFPISQARNLKSNKTGIHLIAIRVALPMAEEEESREMEKDVQIMEEKVTENGRII